MFLVLLLLFLVARFASAQTGAEIAYDLFDYTGTTDLASNGGHGFAAKWTATGRCIVQPFSPPQSPNFTSFAKKIQIGSNRKDPDEAWICELQRPFAMQFSAADTTVRFVSFLLSSEKSVSRDSMFGVALGTLTYLDWEVGVDYLELRRRGNPPFAFMVTHDMSSSGIGSVQTRFEYNMKEIETPRQSARGDHFLVVMKITPISGPIGEKDFDLQLYVYEADYLNNVNASLLDAAPPQRVDPFASSMSIAMLGFFVSQVRAGTTFGSVYTFPARSPPHRHRRQLDHRSACQRPQQQPQPAPLHEQFQVQVLPHQVRMQLQEQQHQQQHAKQTRSQHAHRVWRMPDANGVRQRRNQNQQLDIASRATLMAVHG
jgi:hypothetical protein